MSPGKPKTWSSVGCRRRLALSAGGKSLLNTPTASETRFSGTPEHCRRKLVQTVQWYLVKHLDKVTRVQFQKCNALDLTLQQTAAVDFSYQSHFAKG